MWPQIIKICALCKEKILRRVLDTPLNFHQHHLLPPFRNELFKLTDLECYFQPILEPIKIYRSSISNVFLFFFVNWLSLCLANAIGHKHTQIINFRLFCQLTLSQNPSFVYNKISVKLSPFQFQTTLRFCNVRKFVATNNNALFVNTKGEKYNTSYAGQALKRFL